MITVNGRDYRPPNRPVVAVCIDGSEPAYIEQAIAAGVMPWTQRVVEGAGVDLRADCVVPSFTNPNNLSIVTGAPPSVHGISGNYFLDQESGQEIMMNDPALLRAPTLFQSFQQAGFRVAAVTAKDKLCRLLGAGLIFGSDGAVCCSAERADKATVATHGIDQLLEKVKRPLPSVYSAELSEFVFAVGVLLMVTKPPDILYLSTTDYVQHKHAPGSECANQFYAMMDSYWARLDDLGALIALTADHGMNAKHTAEGVPDTIFLQSFLDQLFGTDKLKVILPITDPYVVHHGALGSFATVYCEQHLCIPAAQSMRELPGIEAVLTRSEACQRFELPADRIGDLVVISGKHQVIGTSAEQHDLSGLHEPLRSHGGISEQRVPLILSQPIAGVDTERTFRNFDLFDIALNHCRNIA
jgi:phosphonoacetate hydrolase